MKFPNVIALSGVLMGLAFSAGAEAPLAGGPIAYDVRPSETDSAIRSFDQPHRIFLDAAAAPRGQLLLFLPGTGATTGEQEEFGRTAAGLGYHVVYLMYPNDVPAAVCQDDEDEGCFERFRREIIEGDDLDARVTVDRANSIENRFLRLVRWLATNCANEGWRQFLTEDAVAWSSVVLAGHSQGGGHAQLMAKDHAVARVVVLGSPKDYSRQYGRPATWYGGGVTPAKRMFALVHRQDTQAVSYAEQMENLRASGLTAAADVDALAPPYGQAQVLTTNQPGSPINSALAHLGLVFDFMLPRGSRGELLYRPVWNYMLTAPVT
jgi:pimeloyl-ACP methyl ester carboxylesterase